MILFVDDEDLILTMARRMLGDTGFEILTATNLAEAHALLVQHGRNIGVVVLDKDLPDGDGWEFGAKARELAPRARIVRTSGYPDSEANGDEPAGVFLQKPYHMGQIAELLGTGNH